MFKFTGRRPQQLGVAGGKFSAPASAKPNWVSSQTDPADRKHHVEPLAFATAPDRAMEKLKRILQSLPRVSIVEARGDYLYAEFSSALMGYVDDVEFYCDGKAIQLRSSSRLGYSDLGANRKRVDSLRAAYST
ncbi:MAG: DUF1499 domain-containing protein [Stenotrophobium sp.]